MYPQRMGRIVSANDSTEIAIMEAAAKVALVANEQWHTYSEEGPSRCPCSGELYSVCTTVAKDVGNDRNHKCIATARGYDRKNAYAIAAHVAAASPAAVLKLIDRLRDTEHERDEMIRQVEIMKRQVEIAEKTTAETFTESWKTAQRYADFEEFADLKRAVLRTAVVTHLYIADKTRFEGVTPDDHQWDMFRKACIALADELNRREKAQV